jgi:hypothetical protein
VIEFDTRVWSCEVLIDLGICDIAIVLAGGDFVDQRFLNLEVA